MLDDCQKQLGDLFDHKFLKHTARDVGFCKRTSKVNPVIFFDILTLCASSSKNISLEQACNEVAYKYGISLNKQSLDERFCEASVLFIQSLLRVFLEQQVSAVLNPGFLKKFNYVRIADSTKFDVPKEFKEVLPGFNGRISSAAGISVQYEFDIKSGKVLCLDINSATTSDSKYAQKTIKNIYENDLVIRDLGFYSKKNLLDIKNKKAFFISRLNAKTKVYEETTKGAPVEISFGNLYQEMVEMGITSKEIMVYIGDDKNLPVRLMVQIMPDEVYAKRITKLNKYNKANGHQTSLDIKDRYRFNLFVTNIEPDILDLQQICLLYKIRWQVELTFKIWKSGFQLASLQKMKYHRYMTILYAKLLLIVINQQIILSIRQPLYWKHKKILSMAKCFGTLRVYNGLIRELLDKPEKSTMTLKKIISRLAKNHWLEKRKNKHGLEEIISSFNCIPDIYSYI